MVTDNNAHLAFFRDLAQELESIVISYNTMAFGLMGKDELLKLRLEQNDRMMEMLKKHRRTMDYMQGKPVEPMAHSAEAVLLPVGGMAG